MKTVLAAMILCCAALSHPSAAQEAAPYSAKQLRAIRTSILNNMQDESVGIRESTLLLVLELKDVYSDIDLDAAIPALMGVLKNDELPELRILAACALYRFDSQIARYAVARRALYDDNGRVARHCANVSHCWTKKAHATAIAAVHP